MSIEKNQETPRRLPKGFAPGSSGLASEYAREMGWDLNEDERRNNPLAKQASDGGLNDEYGAQDFGDEAKDTSTAAKKEGGPANNDAENASKEKSAAAPKVFWVRAPVAKPASGRGPAQIPFAVRRTRTA